MYPLCSRISLCSFCVAKNLHYRVATCVKNTQNTKRVKHDLRNIFGDFIATNELNFAFDFFKRNTKSVIFDFSSYSFVYSNNSAGWYLC